jgi:hypothetical protein
MLLLEKLGRVRLCPVSARQRVRGGISMPKRRANPVILSAQQRSTLEGSIARGRAPARPRPHTPEDTLGRRRSRPDMDRHRDHLRPGGEPLDGLPDAHPLRSGGTSSRPRPSRSAAHQAQQARRFAGGAPDRARLLGASQGQKALERSASRAAVRGAGVRRGFHLQGVGQAYSQKSALKPWLEGQ